MPAEKNKDARWWQWPMLLGLGVPFAAVIWALAFSRMFHVVQQVFWMYQYLFVAAWCVVMGGRLRAVLSDRTSRDLTLDFTARNWIWLFIVVAVAVCSGVWAILFRAGYGVVSFTWLPFAASIAYLMTKRGESGMSKVFFGAFAFSFGVAIPAYFYTLLHGVYGYFFLSSLWFLTIYVSLTQLYWLRWRDWEREESLENQRDPGVTIGILILLTGCFISIWKNPPHSEMWFYYALGAGSAILYFVDRFFVERISPDKRRLIIWCVFVAPALLLCLLLS